MDSIRKKVISISLSAFLAVTSTGFPKTEIKAETGEIRINEVCAKNTSVPSSDGNCYDFVELYNSTENDIDISGYGLTDDETKPYRFVFPQGSVIKANSETVVYLNSNDFTLEGEYTGSFGLSADGETVTLFSPEGNKVDEITFANISADTSYGRITDGADSYGILSMTPGESNNDSELIKKVVEAPKLSVQSGFYDEEFELTLSAAEGTKIYYTIDSSDPTEASTEYSEALKVVNPQTIEKVPEETTATTESEPAAGKQNGFNFFQQFMNTQQTSSVNVLDEKSAFVVRAVAVDSEGNMSDPICGVYFIGLKDTREYYKNLKVISIVTDEANLLDSKTGIFKNYSQKGREWERPANLQIFSDGNYSYEQNIGIRVHGGYTRRFDQKSLNVYARSDYGPSSFKYDLFSGNLRSEATGKKIKEFDSFILRNAGNDNGSVRFRDKMNQSLVSDRDFLTQAMEPCIVFINGSFYGHMEITEKISKEYFKSHLDIPKKDIAIMKNQNLKEGTQENIQECNDLWNWIKTADFSDDSVFEELCSKIDMNNFTDYMCCNIYIGNNDWGSNNVSMWKSNTIDDSNPYMDGKWRFNMFDTEYSENMYGQIPSSTNTFSKIMNQRSFISDLLKAALKNEKYKAQFIAAFMDIANNNFNTEKVDMLIDELSTSYEEFANETVQLFYNRDNYTSEVQKVKEFLDTRYTNILKGMKSSLKLSGEAVSLMVNNDSKFGTVKVGTVSTNSAYTGNYFTDYPVPVEVTPNEGYKAVGWKLSDGRIILDGNTGIKLTGPVSAEPIYEEISSNEPDPVISGDINGDKVTDLTDLTMLSLYLMRDLELTIPQITAADIDDSKEADIADLSYYKQFICKDAGLNSNIKIGIQK